MCIHVYSVQQFDARCIRQVPQLLGIKATFPSILARSPLVIGTSLSASSITVEWKPTMDSGYGSRDTRPSQSTPDEWSSEDLVCLQRAARAIRIPLSDLLRFAEANATKSSHSQQQAGDLSLSTHAVHNIQSVSINDEIGNASMSGLLPDHPTPAQLTHPFTPNDGLGNWSTSTLLDLAPSGMLTRLAPGSSVLDYISSIAYVFGSIIECQTHGRPSNRPFVGR